MGLFKKKGVPAELPSLSLGGVSPGVSTPVSRPIPQSQPVSPTVNPVFQPPVSQPSVSNVQQPAQQAQPVSTAPAEQHPIPEAPMPQAKKWSNFLKDDNEPGYFKELVKNITEENGDVGKLEQWYKEKFLPGDMVFHMREYWQKQQPEILLKNISGELKDKLMNKTERLHQLEREWQEVYFHLMTKEDEIRKEEGELKAALSEFVDMHKRTFGDGKK
jgi:hypothetical protein